MVRKTIVFCAFLGMIGMMGFSSAAEIQSQQENPENRGNWTESFKTHVGLIRHTPDHVDCSGYKSYKIFTLHFKRGTKEAPLSCILVLSVDLSRKEFMDRLIEAGVIKESDLPSN